MTDESVILVPDHAAFGRCTGSTESFGIAVDTHVNVALAQTTRSDGLGLVHDTATRDGGRPDHGLIVGKGEITTHTRNAARKRTRGQIFAHHLIAHGGRRGCGKVETVPVASLRGSFAMTCRRVAS